MKKMPSLDKVMMVLKDVLEDKTITAISNWRDFHLSNSEEDGNLSMRAYLNRALDNIEAFAKTKYSEIKNRLEYGMI